jgi:hypothetical protein
MTLWLPNPSGDSSAFGEIRDLLTEIRRYRACELPENVKNIICAVAMNSEVSKKVLDKLKSELPVSHKEYFRIHVIFWTVLLVFVISPLLTQFIPIKQSYVNELMLLALVANFTFFILRYLDWRTERRDPYIADFLIRTLEFGLRYQYASADERLRDGLALMIQRTAARYAIVYKRSDSSRFFAAQVRRQARDCRNDIMTLIPGLVTAGQFEIKNINENLTRLLIRTQTGYWHQTEDIAKEGMPMRRGDAIRISLASFIEDRPIQVAFIGFVAAIVTATIGLIKHI